MAVEGKLSFMDKYVVEKGFVKPNRRLFTIRSEHVRQVFTEFIEKLGRENFYLSTIVGTDMKDEGRIRLDYYVVLLPEEETIVIRTYLPRDNPVVDSIIDLLPGALSGECETYDLLGVVFKGNSFLKRGFFIPQDLVEQGRYPLRKDSGV
ncbi:NADH-quinone oxidoreductase subunit C [Desulfurococcus amylolyticus]|uniref:NADH dehydrogenase (Ubiquinone) 30 kDa subunit n=1 Tax=Desulfurococcus amylolyticus DSM 16532 TaxID=768672 RepID=I3XQM7_DESAM|nr:NADH-quinone oxidoreductase subunit C [Desulfurococcus amylolyticus]AFL66251.1 NADH dehydrogenase (ubiquinone) 30 kDa subunit [Desulfurococcus amylolyticus DSM 16532]